MSETLTNDTAAEIAAMAAGLDALRVWAEAHPEIPVQQASSSATWIVRTYMMSDPDHAEIVRAIADGAPLGAVTKTPTEINGGTMFVERDFGGGVKVQHQAARDEVCERVVVGTETVTVPGPVAPLVEVEREVVEWRCAPILGGAS